MRLIITNLLLILLLVSCKTSNDVITGRKFQKRKYTSGWYVQSRDKGDTQKDTAPFARPTFDRVEHSEIQTTETLDVLLTDSIENHAASCENSTGESTQNIRKKKRGNPLIEKLGCMSMPGLSIGQLAGADNQGAFADKRKGRKEKLEPLTLWGWNCVAISSWLLGWPIHLPIVAIPLIALGIILLIVSLTKLRKNKKRNKRMCFFGIALGILLLVISFLV